MLNDRNIRCRLTADEADRLRLAIERAGKSRSWLAGQIIRQWLSDPHRTVSVDRLSGDVGLLTPTQRELVRRRLRLLKGWQRAMTYGVRRGSGAEAVTTAYLRGLPQRDRVGRGTLYNWQRRYQGHGIAGLVDQRATARDKAVRGTIKRALKAV
jgi:hypothetical protein